MKHKLREEKNCLNCGSRVEQRYCPNCGQENKEPKESFGELIYEFFADFTHFDSKLFKSMKYLLFRPGFLTREYLSGKRKMYLHPIRMYIFISFVYFLTSGLLNKSDHLSISSENKNTAAITKVQQTLDSIKSASKDNPALLLETARQLDSLSSAVSNPEYVNLRAYDSIQNSLPADQQTKGIKRYFERKNIKWKETYPEGYQNVVKERFTHAVPTAMFILLPLFALFLKWLYRKEKYYVSHAIFSLHFHCFVFFILLLCVLVGKAINISDLETFAYWISFFYLIFALRNFYNQSFVRSLFKGILLVILYGIALSLVFVGLALYIFTSI